MTARPDAKRWRWMTKRLTGFIFATAFVVFIGLVVLVDIGPLDESLLRVNLFVIAYTALLALWSIGHCVWAGAKGYSPLLGVPLAVMPILGVAVLALYLPDRRLLSNATRPH
jgi:hypothetical protein